MYTNTFRRRGEIFERTYSWRTRGSFVEKKDRKTYLKSQDKTSARLLNQEPYKGHSFTQDAGHTFINFKMMHVSGGYRRVDRRNGKFLVDSQIIPAPVYPQEVLDFVRPGKFGSSMLESSGFTPNGTLLAGAGILSTQLRQSVSGSYNSMIPDTMLGWGETVVELAQGNFPAVLRNLQARAKRGRQLDPYATGKDLGSEYLNLNFGIKPILMDTLKLTRHLSGVTGLMFDDFKRRRKTPTHFMKYGSNTAMTKTVDGVKPGAPNFRGRTTAHFLSCDAHMSASFTKAKPTGALLQKDRELDDQLDLLSLDTLAWDLLPFSWLVDWFSNIGSSIENFAAFAPDSGRYVTNYSWVTEQYRSILEFPGFETRDTYTDTSVDRSTTTWTYTHRRHISPFGLNFTVPNLTQYQWSILVALGLARGRK